MDASQSSGELRSDYLDNIFGLIQRAIWPYKPLIGLNLNEIALELGIISYNDLNTSIGLSVIGESYYQLRQYGIAIAIFQAIIFRHIESFQYKKQLIWRASYIPLCFLVVARDSYVYIVPLLITQFVVIYLVSLISRKWK